MFRRLRELGPAVLVPLAWTFVTAAHLGTVTDHTLFVAHVVMAVLLAGFAVTGRADMRDGTLRVWWSIIVVGLVLTVGGAVGFHLRGGSAVLLGGALFGWMLLPAVGFVDTGRRATDGGWIYLGGAGACLLGALVYAVGPLGASGVAVAGLALVGIGQTAGILHAAVRY
ncbi:MAG: hypothetical protein ABEH35_04105 [Haloarculaceae archaeon]